MAANNVSPPVRPSGPSLLSAENLQVVQSTSRLIGGLQAFIRCYRGRDSPSPQTVTYEFYAHLLFGFRSSRRKACS